MKNSNKVCYADIVVCGGGLAGTAAAIAAARQGKKVVLIEENGVLGGAATIGLVTPLDSCESKSKIAFGGLIQEIVGLTEQLSVKYCKGQNDTVGTVDRASPHILKYVLLKLCIDAGVSVLFHTRVIGVNVDRNAIESVEIQDKDGKKLLHAKVFIDGSGDGVLIEESGASYVLGSENDTFEQLQSTGLAAQHEEKQKIVDYGNKAVLQPVSIFFVMGGVDIKIAHQYCNRTLTFEDLSIRKEDFEKWAYANTLGFEIKDNDKLPLPQGRILLTGTPRSGVYAVNMSRVIGIDASNADSLNEGEINAQLQLIAIVDFLKSFVPGFEKAYLQESGFTLGIRETRRLKGKYVLKGTDVYYTRQFENAIARGFYLIDIHNPHGNGGAIGGQIRGDYYDIPYECLIDEEVDNLLVCGRCISADHVAHSATRIQGTCIATGEAAGVAAALSVEIGVKANALSAKAVANILKENGVFLD